MRKRSLCHKLRSGVQEVKNLDIQWQNTTERKLHLQGNIYIIKWFIKLIFIILFIQVFINFPCLLSILVMSSLRLKVYWPPSVSAILLLNDGFSMHHMEHIDMVPHTDYQTIQPNLHPLVKYFLAGVGSFRQVKSLLNIVAIWLPTGKNMLSIDVGSEAFKDNFSSLVCNKSNFFLYIRFRVKTCCIVMCFQVSENITDLM